MRPISESPESCLPFKLVLVSKEVIYEMMEVVELEFAGGTGGIRAELQIQPKRLCRFNLPISPLPCGETLF